MDYYNADREWEVSSITQGCNNVFNYNPNSTVSHCLLHYDINVVRFSSMYYSSVVIPAVGMMIHCIRYVSNQCQYFKFQ